MDWSINSCCGCGIDVLAVVDECNQMIVRIFVEGFLCLVRKYDDL